MAQVPSMPARGDRNTPQFDKTQPHELRRYFDDLEFHFGRCQVQAEKDKKAHSHRFLDVNTSDIWESIPEFADTNTTYDNFKTAIYRLYPGSEDERKWSVAVLEPLTADHAKIGIHSLGDLGDYHRQFLAIAAFLFDKGRLSVDDKNHKFADGFQPDLWSHISQRLQLKFSDHYPDNPYSLADIEATARFVLHGTTSAI
jgi:hypothetical protein